MFLHNFSRVPRIEHFMKNVRCLCYAKVLNCRSEDISSVVKCPKLQTTNHRSFMNYSQSRLCVKVSLSAFNTYDWEDNIKSKALKVLSVKVTSLRVDIVLKATLQMTRNKIESAFYENKIRVNGRKVQKKSAPVSEGDEVDVAEGPGAGAGAGPGLVRVARVEVLEVEDGDDQGFVLKFRKYKTLAEADTHAPSP